MPTVSPLRLVSYLAPNQFELYQAVGQYLGRVLPVEPAIAQGEFDPLADPQMRQDEWDMAFICGLPLIRYSQAVPNHLIPISAPVMQAARYQNRPIYFSDLIVRSTDAITSVEHLAGKTFCYNDLGSNSGYHMMQYYLLQQQRVKFFGRVIPSGSHQRSIQWVIEGRADCAAIDSTVLDRERHNHPELSSMLHVVDSIGPYPIPPLAASQRLGKHLLSCIQGVLLHPDLQLKQEMERFQVRRFASVNLSDYDAIAHSLAAVTTVENPLMDSQHPSDRL